MLSEANNKEATGSLRADWANSWEGCKGFFYFYIAKKKQKTINA